MPKSVTGSNSGRVTVKVGEWSLFLPGCLAPWKSVFLRHGRRRGCLGASCFDAGSARPRKCVFLRHGRRRGCLGASRFGAGSARFNMV
ncbi:hypothetical protein L3X38_010767 [Prunus dulcis]|uniref:Uncharacterized protein n=1 Tax=Prunus dulcis TaxID=3755 RepID=A0AAD4ZER6_PRUDU|nr:hypothetical protein L3X38_010767 [Prunus dulcis]